MKTFTTMMITVGVIAGIVGYAGMRIPIRSDTASSCEDKQTKLERMLQAKAEKHTEALSGTERSAPARSRVYLQMEQEIPYPDAEGFVIQDGNERDVMRQRILKLAAFDTSAKGKDDAAMFRSYSPAAAKIAEALPGDQADVKRSFQSSPDQSNRKTGEAPRDTFKDAGVNAPDSPEMVKGQNTLALSGKQINGNAGPNPIRNWKMATQDISPRTSAQISLKTKTLIIFIQSFPRVKSDRRRIKAAFGYGVPLVRVTDGHMFNLRGRFAKY